MTKHSRRDFLTRTLSATVAAGSTFALLDAPVARSQQRVMTAPTVFALEIDGAPVGRPDSVDGGDIVGDVVAAAADTSGIVRKHLGGVKYADIVVTCGAGMSKPFFDWVRTSLAGQPVRKNGAIVTLGNDLKPMARAEWMNGLSPR
jgi:hypothetical protein